MTVNPHAESLRPLYALENHEDEIYHSFPQHVKHINQLKINSATAPEYYSFVGQSWVFNRAMRWVDGPDGVLLCYSEGGPLSLTGSKGGSEWFSDPVNEISNDGGFTRFVRKSSRQRDCIVLPAFQFCLNQHPSISLEVSDADAPWQFCVLRKGRGGPPLLSSSWREGSARLDFDLAAELRKRGFNLHFAELFFVIGMWSADPAKATAIRFALRLDNVPAIIPSLPVIRTVSSTQKHGMPVAGLVLGKTGDCLRSDNVTLTAHWGAKSFKMLFKDSCWSVNIPQMSVGDHTIRLVSSGEVEQESTLVVRVTDGNFIGYDPKIHSLVCNGKPSGPVSGSYAGLFYFKNAGGSDEALVQGQEQFDAWDRTQPPGEHLHYWEALTEEELDERFKYLAKNGYRLLHLCQHWGTWEKLDAGGHIAPFGAEQVALYYRVASRHGLAVVQALSHYPYKTPSKEHTYHGTPPYRQHIEAGFKDDDWKNVQCRFTERFHNYLNDYVLLFRDETAIAYLTTSGEGDIAAGPDRVNDTCRFVRNRDTNHLFLSEPIFRLTHLPFAQPDDQGPWWSRFRLADWEQPLFASRIYWIGEKFEPELDLGIECKLMQLGPVFIGEGSWPCNHLHVPMEGVPDTWCGTEEYRTRVRDSLYIGLAHRIPIILFWDEQMTENEHRLFDVIRRRVDWSQPFIKAPVALMIDNSNMQEQRETLRCYEEIFSAIPLVTCYLTPETPVPEGVCLVIDARQQYKALEWFADTAAIPEEIKRVMPMTISAGYRASYCWSQDRRTLLAYIYNCTGHKEKSYTLGGRFHRLPKETALQVRLRNFPDSRLSVSIYDLEKKRLVQEKKFAREFCTDLGTKKADYFILVTPK